MAIQMNLVFDKWIASSCGTLSLLDLFEKDAEDISLPPISRVAVLRLCLWILWQAQGSPVKWLKGKAQDFDLMGASRFMQSQDIGEVSGTLSARDAHQIINQIDAGNPALDPNGVFNRMSVEASTAVALVTAYMADRGGIKAGSADTKAKGIPLSGSFPAIVNKYVVMYSGDTILDALNKNFALMTQDVAAAIMFPWRNLWVKQMGKIIVCAGSKSTASDPWAGNRARPLFNPESNFGTELTGDVEISAIVCNQAKPIAHWRRRCTLPPTESSSS